ncbi:MAG: DUF547 domain-containing protein [Arenimonas sp.]
MTRILALLLLALASFGTQAQSRFDQSHAVWNALLGKHVHWNATSTASSVNYAGFKNDRVTLNTYLATLSAVKSSDFNHWSVNEQRAFLINAYNAYTVELILTKYPNIKSIKDLGSLFSSPWSKPFFTLLGEKRSLDDIEHTLLRGNPDFDEPRIHFAVNCASVGCPALRPEAYRAGTLDKQLEEQTKRFLSDHSRNRYDKSKDTLFLSSIFKWYGDDFGKAKTAKNLAEFLSHYAGSLGMTASEQTRLIHRELDIEFLDYDWTLNKER